MQLKMRHTLCWSVPHITPLKNSFNHYLIVQYQGFSIVPFKWTIKSTLPSISQWLLHCRLLELALGTGLFSYNAFALGHIYYRMLLHQKGLTLILDTCKGFLIIQVPTTLNVFCVQWMQIWALMCSLFIIKHLCFGVMWQGL